MVFASIEAHLITKRREGEIQESEADLLTDYMYYLQNTRNMSDKWIKNNYHQLYRAICVLHDCEVSIEGTTTADIQKASGMIRHSGYSINYKRHLVLSLKNFFLWYSKKNPNLDLNEMKEIVLPPAQWKTKKPEDMLTKEEVLQTLSACTNTRDKAIIAMLYDGSHRPIEVLDLKWNEINEDEDGYYYLTSKKTGNRRRIRMTFAIPFYETWKNDYPGVAAGENHVFVTLNRMNGRKEHKPMTKANLDRLILILKDRTGIQKLKSSIFRPSKITHDVVDGYELPYIMLKNWGNLKTNMIDVYTNVSDDYIDQEALRKAGLIRIEKDPDMKEIRKLQPKQCVCGEICAPHMKYCPACRLPLTEEARVERRELQNLLDNLTPEQLIEMLQEKMR